LEKWKENVFFDDLGCADNVRFKQVFETKGKKVEVTPEITQLRDRRQEHWK
jgi:hypothetical protein